MKAKSKYFSDKNFIVSFLSGLMLLVASLIVQFFTAAYLSGLHGTPVEDIILSNTRVYEVDGIFIYGTLALFFIGLFLAHKHVNKVPFTLKSIAVFILIRSVFVCLTHFGPYPSHVLITSAFFSKEAFNGIFVGNDLFFSGHTGMPFLVALMVWDDKWMRAIFLCFSLLFAVVVLMGHIHYSIDVLAAFFITYSIFNICKYLFKDDWKLFLSR